MTTNRTYRPILRFIHTKFRDMYVKYILLFIVCKILMLLISYVVICPSLYLLLKLKQEALIWLYNTNCSCVQPAITWVRRLPTLTDQFPNLCKYMNTLCAHNAVSDIKSPTQSLPAGKKCNPQAHIDLHTFRLWSIVTVQSWIFSALHAHSA